MIVGFGIYFAVNASYSDGGYALTLPSGEKQMFLCEVALGTPRNILLLLAPVYLTAYVVLPGLFVSCDGGC